MHRWQVGDATIVRVEDSSFALPTTYPVPDWMVPHFAPTADEIGMGFSAVGISVDGLRIVVDPWLGDDGPRERSDAREHATALLGELATAGFAPEAVDLVINSHVDGCGWNTRPAADGTWVPAFPNARYLFPAAELAAIDAGNDILGGAAIGVLRDSGVVDAIAEADCAGDGFAVSPSVRLLDAPGHNFGHVAVQVTSAGDAVVLPGHVILSPIQVDDPAFDVGDTDLAAATATRETLLASLAERDGLLVTTLLGGPGGGRVARDGTGYALRADHTP